MAWHLGIDIGGTFTDALALADTGGAARTAKVWSVKDDAQATIAAVLEALGLRADEVAMLTFGTTIVTNAIIQRRLARVALITTAGFSDVLDIARQNRRFIYDIATPPREPSPVPPERRHEIGARTGPDGAVRQPLAVAEVDAVVERIGGQCDAVAVSLLHAYANGEHERAVGERVRARCPHVSLSHEVWPQLKEYERTLATVLNASVMPLVSGHLAALEEFLPAALRLELFHSAGGMMTPEAATVLPLSLALSGPAAGVAAAQQVAVELEVRRGISLDMGGTTTDVCLIRDGQAEVHEQAEVGPWQVNLPMLAVHSIGAGGGSLVSLGAAGLRVGPRSAGADPGPACYGRGGTSPTLTDAAVVLGYLRPSGGRGGAVRIHEAAARAALAPLADRLRLDVERVARGVLQVANANMARAMRRISVDRGVDMRECELIAFGGAAPMYAAELAREVGIRRVIVPRDSSLLSAAGCLTTTPAYTRQRTIRLGEDGWQPHRFAAACAAVAGEARENLMRGRNGEGTVDLEYLALMRYLGQSYAIGIACTPHTTREALTSAFRQRHEALYGYHTEEPWEVQSLRVTARLRRAAGVMAPPQARGPAGPVAVTTCRFEGGAAATPVHDRAALGAGEALAGPLMVVDDTSTTVVPPGCSLTATAGGHLCIEVGARS